MPAEEPEADKAPDDFHPMRVRPYVAADGIGQPTAQTSVPRPQDLVFFQDEPPPEATDGTSPRQVRQAQYMALRAIGFVAVAALTLTGTIIAITDKAEVRTKSASQLAPSSLRSSSSDVGLVSQPSPTASPSSSATGPAAEVKPDTAGIAVPRQRQAAATTTSASPSASAEPSKTPSPSKSSMTRPRTRPGKGSSPPHKTTHSLRSVNYRS